MAQVKSMLSVSTVTWVPLALVSCNVHWMVRVRLTLISCAAEAMNTPLPWSNAVAVPVKEAPLEHPIL